MKNDIPSIVTLLTHLTLWRAETARGGTAQQNGPEALHRHPARDLNIGSNQMNEISSLNSTAVPETAKKSALPAVADRIAAGGRHAALEKALYKALALSQAIGLMCHDVADTFSVSIDAVNDCLDGAIIEAINYVEDKDFAREGAA